MNHRGRTLVASVAIVLVFFLIQVGTLALVEPFQQEGHQIVEDTDDPTISIVYLLAILVVTGLMLAAIKYGGESILRLVIIFAGAYIALFVFQVFAPDATAVTLDGVSVNLLAVVGALAVAVALYVYPEWYVIDAAGIIMGIGAAGLFGVNFGVLPAIVLLVVLAVYDAVSVYGTEHMLTLASGAMDMRVPVVLIFPVSLSYSFLDDDTPEHLDGDDSTEGDVKTAPEGVDELDAETLPDREALFIGLGDAVIPTVLVASAAFFVDAGPEFSFLIASASLPAVTAMIGTLLGLVVLLWMVLKGRAHAGLPLLNGGAIAGYLVGALASGLSLVEALGLSAIL